MRPRESFERSRRPSGASGGAADFGGPAAWTGKCGFGAVAGLAAADGSVGVSVGCALATRGFFRSGLTCLATLSHSARSSSLKPRLRRG